MRKVWQAHIFACMLAGRLRADACGVLALTARHGSCMCETLWVCSISCRELMPGTVIRAQQQSSDVLYLARC